MKAHQLLGRDSESLFERNFARTLKDAHDAGIVDLRKRGDAFEVTAAAGLPSIADQLAVAEKAATPAAVASAPAPRGMGQRSVPSKGRGGAKPGVPAGLLLLGMVDEPSAPVIEPVAEVVEAPKKGKAKKPAAKAEKAEKAEKVEKAKPEAKAKKASVKKAASKKA